MQSWGQERHFLQSMRTKMKICILETSTPRLLKRAGRRERGLEVEAGAISWRKKRKNLMAAHLYSIPAPTLPSTTLRRPLAGAGARVATGWGTELGRRYGRLVAKAAAGSDVLGDIGARDPFPEELESNFGDKVIGNANTEHQILVPVSSALALWNLECRPLSPADTPFSYDDAQKLLRKVVGWRLVDKDGSLRLHCLWKLKDSASADELVSRIRRAVEHTDHCPEFSMENSTNVTAELWSSSIGGLSMNDFIVAAIIDRVKTSDLLPRKRVWA